MPPATPTRAVAVKRAVAGWASLGTLAAAYRAAPATRSNAPTGREASGVDAVTVGVTAAIGAPTIGGTSSTNAVNGG